MMADLMMDIISSNSDREVSSPEIFKNVGPFRSFPHSPCPTPNEILGSATFTLTHATPLLASAVEIVL